MVGQIKFLCILVLLLPTISKDIKHGYDSVGRMINHTLYWVLRTEYTYLYACSKITRQKSEDCHMESRTDRKLCALLATRIQCTPTGYSSMFAIVIHTFSAEVTQCCSVAGRPLSCSLIDDYVCIDMGACHTTTGFSPFRQGNPNTM
jgi:hypothetical protein